MPLYRDMASNPEDERIEAIGKAAMSAPGTVAFITDDEPGKPERYIKKLLAKFPQLELLGKSKGPIRGVVSVLVGRILGSSETN